MCRIPPNWSTCSTQPQSNRGPRLMFEELLHLLPMLYQLACGPNYYESGCCSCFPKMGVVSERAIKCDTMVGRPIVVPQPFPIYNYVQLLVNSSIVQVESTRHRLATLGCSRQRLQYSMILAMSALMVVFRSSNVRAWWTRPMSSA